MDEKLPNRRTDARFERRLSELRAQVIKWCRAYFSSLADVEDAAQESMLRAWRKRQLLKDESQFTTWLRRVTQNVCLSRCCSAADHQTVPIGEWVVDSGSSAFEIAFCNLLVDRIEEMLSPRARAVFRCRYVLGFSSSEIANDLPENLSFFLHWSHPNPAGRSLTL